ncbi:pentapeptide repeat-containing protein [uncultured Sphingobium sp.]|uniref:pentapeptide repeat-containing protein n=1 Tax=uncultured Sphingobium sp. TaxID=316087 RepID=UPI003423EB57
MAGVNLTSATVVNVNLFWTDMKGAILKDAVLTSCRMNRVSLIGADLSGANFSHSNMIEADLRNADMTNARFQSSNMNGADLSRAIMPGANFHLAMIRDLLSSAANRGTGSAAALRTSTFGKTGTTQDSRDAIFVGYAGGLVTAVWIGNDDNSPLPGGAAGGGVPARIWRNFMSGAINEPVEDAPEDTQDADLVNAIANITVETGIGNLELGVDEDGMTVNLGPNQLRLPSDPPAPVPPANAPPPPIARTQPAGEEDGP